MFLRLRMIMWKEFIQISRDPRLLAVVVIIPLVMLLLYGYAINFDVRNLRLAIFDQDRSQASRELIGVFTESEYFRIVEYLQDHRQVTTSLDGNTAQLVLVIPPTYSRDLADGRTAQVQVLVNGSDSTTASTGIGYIAAILQQQSATVSLQALARQGVHVARVVQPVDNRVRYWYNAELRSTNYLVPGLVAMILMMLAALLTSVTVVRERERGTIEQLIVSPIRPVQLMLGKAIPFVIIGYADILLVISVGRLWFRVPIAGSVTLLLCLSGLFIMTTLGLGLLISTMSHTQQQAMMLGFFANPPFMLLSGFIFPIASMPEPMQYLTYLIPLRYFLVIIRGIFLKGVGLDVLWPQALALAVFGVAVLVLSALRFQKRLG